jgi:hypothetical protein
MAQLFLSFQLLGTVTIGLKNRQEIALQGRERADASAILKLCDPAHRDAARRARSSDLQREALQGLSHATA